ncbi:MAG: ABC transporter permease subunit [Bacteriovoracaceae bacterium]|nr:ABC transporter permease subunit [Bacteriovoracaceae bacterium]
MTAYFTRRLLLMIPTFLGITLMVFTITRFVPGGPIERMITQMQMMQGDQMETTRDADESGSGAALSDEQRADLEEYYGFDKPIIVSYLTWLGKVVRLDLGMSTRFNEPVWDLIKSRIPISLTYGLTSMLIIYLVTIPLGIFKAIKHNSAFDNISSSIIFVTYAIPGYIIGLGVLVLFAFHWEVFPLGGFISEDFDDFSRLEQLKDVIWHGVLPMVAYVAGSFAGGTFLMKNVMMDNLAADYIRTAMAKGLDFKKAVVRHALRNSLVPIATGIGHSISVILSGSFLIETIFNIDGMGLLGYESILQRDYPVVLGILAISSTLFLIGNILSDIAVALVDPRVQFGK